MINEDEQNDFYRDGRNTHYMKGTVVPSARKGNREDSGVRFDPHNPKFDYNIVVVDEHGSEKKVGVSAATHEQMTRDLRDGKSVNYNEILKKGSPPVESFTMPLDTNKTASSIDDSVPDTEETLTLPRVMRMTAAPVDEHTVAVKIKNPLRREKFVEKQMEEKVQEEEKPANPEPIPVYESPKPLEANKPVSRRPADLDLEPDPAPGPEQVSSYTVERDEDGKVKPLLAPIETPGGSEFEELNLERDEGINLGEMPNIPTHAPESKGVLIVRPSVNLHSAPMKAQRVKVRFISQLGKLAVPYNLVFRYGIALVMIQHSEEAIFYDPPQAPDLEIEVWWHGNVFICFPGMYIEFPDQQTAQTIFLIDEDKTRAKRKELTIKP